MGRMKDHLLALQQEWDDSDYAFYQSVKDEANYRSVHGEPALTLTQEGQCDTK